VYPPALKNFKTAKITCVERELRIFCDTIGEMLLRDKKWNKLRHGETRD